jgi:tetratricopeptide (TPR) repeat protein
VFEAAAVLVDFSLLRKSGPGLVLVEALREVAAERLAVSPELEDLRRAHAAALIVLGRSVRSPSTAGAAAMASVERLLPDTWAAARWTREHDAAMHRALVSNMSAFWAMKGGLRATIGELEAALSREDLPPGDRADLLLSKAHILLLAGRPKEGLAAVQEGLALMPDRSDLDRGGDLHALSQAQMEAGFLEEAIATGRSSLEHHRRSGSRERTVLSLVTLAQTMMRNGNTAEAGRLLDEAEILGEGLETIVAMGVENIRADWALTTGDPRRALSGYVESLPATMADFGQFVLYDIAGIAVALEQLGAWEAALEVASMAEAGAVEWGTTVDTFNRYEGGVPAARDRARLAVSSDAARAAEVRGRVVAPRARAQRALAFAREVLSREGVR